MTEKPQNQEAVPRGAETRTQAQRIFGVVMEVAAPAVWLYGILQVWVLDVDSLLIGLVGSKLAWIVIYKLPVLLGLLLLAVFAVGWDQLSLAVLFVLFYPVVLAWRTSSAIYKGRSWNLAFALVNSVIVFFRSLKQNIVIFSSYIILAVLVLKAHSKPLLWASIILIFLLLMAVYIRSIIFALRPSGVFWVYRGISRWIVDKGAVSAFRVDPEMKDVSRDQFTEAQLDRWKNNLQLPVLANRFFLVTARQLKEYQESGINLLSYVIIIFLLLLFTVFSFALLNLGLDKISPSEFSVSLSGFFNFFYYSFSNLFYRQIPGMVPLLRVSQIILMLENLSSVLLLAVVVTLFLTIKNQRYSDELTKAVREVEAQGAAIEELIRSEYRISSVDEAVQQLVALKAGFVSLIIALTNAIGPEGDKRDLP